MNTILTDTNFINYYKRLLNQEPLAKEEFMYLLTHNTDETRTFLQQSAASIRRKHFGSSVYIRGLIEFSNYCKNDCYYCGIRNSNHTLQRYRLSKSEILKACEHGFQHGFRTFVLQSGEDPYYTDTILCDIVSSIHQRFPDCAITLSLGERSYESYEKLYASGATRYLLRHETADSKHYQKLHPNSMSFDNRIQCLKNLKKIGYQVGCGFMVGSPGQTAEHLAQDLYLIQELKPHMIGIGPFLSHKDTPFCSEPNGTLEETLFLLSLLRIMQPDLLLPATTSLETLHPSGRLQGILAGANVIMPNLLPRDLQRKYSLYDKKACTNEDLEHVLRTTNATLQSFHYQIVSARGDSSLH